MANKIACPSWPPINMTLSLDSNKPAKEEEEFEVFATVAIDSSHKVSEHYNVLEKLGV